MISNKKLGLVLPGAVLTLVLTAGALTGGQAAVAAAHGTRASAAAGWSVQPTPTPSVPTASPDAISCLTAAWCMSVGSYTGSQGVQQPLAEIWTGTAWHPVSAVPAGGGAVGTVLQGVACTSRKACVAVGYSVHFGARQKLELAPQAFAERWDGSSWHAIALGLPAGLSAQLTNVSCASSTGCAAVGSLGDLEHSREEPRGQGLLVTWNGTRWSRVAVPAPRHKALVLKDVACARTGACTAAGAYLAGNKPNLPFAVSRPRAGAAWRFRILPAPFPTTRAALKAQKNFNLIIGSIACVGADACTVVGNYNHVVNPDKDRIPLFTEAWDGRHWRLLPVPKLRRQPQFASVTCWAPASCLAAGNTGELLAGKPAALRHSGSRWSVATAPASALAFGGQALWCASATSCLAVGAGTSGADQASRLHGTTWTGLTMPSPAGTSGAFLSDVACTLAGRCAAVGGFNSATGRTRTLIESGGPGGWSVSSAPSPAGVFDAELGSVACPVEGFCLALGTTLKIENAGSPKAFSEAWNGSAWRIVPTVDPGTRGNTLADVSCESATDCMAVGYAQVDGFTRRQLIEQWDGSGWQIVTGARLAGATDSQLDSVSCPSTTFCVAIGVAEIGGKQQSIAERFDGHAWMPLSHAGLLAVDLAGLSCISATFCMAVGETADQMHPLAQEWNGSAWKTVVVPSPSPLGDEGATLNDVSCTSAAACTAIGSNDFDVFDPSQEGPRPIDHPFAETWNGTDWSAGSLGAPGGTIGNTLSAIACAALRQCWAVGFSERIKANVPLIEHRSG